MFQNMDRAGQRKMKSKYINKIRMDIGICIENKQQAETWEELENSAVNTQGNENSETPLFLISIMCVHVWRHQKDIFREKKTDVKTHNCCYQRREQNK